MCPWSRLNANDRRLDSIVSLIVKGPQALIRGGELVAIDARQQRWQQWRRVGAGKRFAVTTKQRTAFLEQRGFVRRVREHQAKNILPDDPAHAAEESALNDPNPVIADGVSVDDEQPVFRENKAPQVNAGHVFFFGRPVALIGAAVRGLVPASGNHLEG